MSKSRSRAANLVKELEVLVSEERRRLYAITKAPELERFTPPPLAMLVALKAFRLGVEYGTKGLVNDRLEPRVEAHFDRVAREILKHAVPSTGA
ncbi:MAG: hypothetical protein HY721_10445 [Planctomycetes bacterium]|nr:hypothetical protein [Planctomycetota bacterium]